MSSQLSKISSETQTPFYAYDQAIMKRQLDRVLKNKPENLEIYYAMKGNSNLSIVKWYREQGLGVEIASGGELFIARKAGFGSEQIIYTGPAKTNQELRESLGIKAIHTESVLEAKRLNQICKAENVIQDVLVRVNADFEVKTKVQLSGCPSPFGISEEEIQEAIENIQNLPHLNFKGIHVYNASGILDYKMLLQNVENVFWLVQKLEKTKSISIPVIDFGGGLGIDYSDREEHVDVSAFYHGMKELIDLYGYHDRSLIMEISRYLMAESGFYVTQIIDKKYSRGEIFLITDGGVQHLLRVSFFGENHSTEILSLTSTDETETVNITGSLCTSIDVLAKSVSLPKAEVGDFVVIKKAGCYGLNASMNHFLSHDMPEEILIDGDDFTTIRTRGRYQDLVLNQEEN